MSFWERIDQIRAEHNVLEHPFYVRWSAGDLSAAELAVYAGQYRHAVVALADATAYAAGAAEPEARAMLAAHAEEEAAHVAVWDGFVGAAGGSAGAAPLLQTAACAETWAGGRDRPLLESLVAIHAIEASQPAISIAKLEGLRAHYGLDTPAATAYFELHAERDIEHSAAGRALIDERLGGANQEPLLAQARAVLRANWGLLDGVQSVGAAAR